MSSIMAFQTFLKLIYTFEIIIHWLSYIILQFDIVANKNKDICLYYWM